MVLLCLYLGTKSLDNKIWYDTLTVIASFPVMTTVKFGVGSEVIVASGPPDIPVGLESETQADCKSHPML